MFSSARPTLIPRRLLITDSDRFPDWQAALARLPMASGVILRDYAHPHRAELGERMARACRQKGHVFFVAGDRALATKLGAGYHAPAYQTRHPLRHPLPPPLRGRSLAAAHNKVEVNRAAQHGFGAVLISPVFATASHPNAPCLGVYGFFDLANHATRRGLRVYALGGMTPQNHRRLAASGQVYGFAGITTFNNL